MRALLPTWCTLPYPTLVKIKTHSDALLPSSGKQAVGDQTKAQAGKRAVVSIKNYAASTSRCTFNPQIGAVGPEAALLDPFWPFLVRFLAPRWT